MTRPPAVDVDGLTKRFGRLTALDRVSFTVPTGIVTGLIGPNGAGKTTLLECMAGLMPFDRGQVRVWGRPAKLGHPAPSVFYLPDGIAPWASETVRWALEFAIGYFGGRAGERAQVIEELGLTHFLDVRIAALSKGQRKRAMLAVGLLTPQPILLCDEPFDGLDLRQTRDIGAALRRHAAGGRTLFLSIHQIADAARVCDRFVLISGGRISGEGALEDLAAASGAQTPAASPTSLEDIFLALT